MDVHAARRQLAEAEARLRDPDVDLEQAQADVANARAALEQAQALDARRAATLEREERAAKLAALEAMAQRQRRAAIELRGKLDRAFDLAAELGALGEELGELNRTAMATQMETHRMARELGVGAPALESAVNLPSSLAQVGGQCRALAAWRSRWSPPDQAA